MAKSVISTEEELVEVTYANRISLTVLVTG